MARAALLLVGSELTDPARRDANGPAARARLTQMGIPVVLLARVEDRVEAIEAAMRAALATCDVVITSGGLGPTGDDLTREGAARLLGLGIHEDPGWIEEIRRRLESRGYPLTEVNRRQALVVDGAEPVPNGKGLACGSWLKAGGGDLVLLPGVPTEFEEMLENRVIPRLKALYPQRPAVVVVRATVAGLAESMAEPVLKPWYGLPGVAVSILPSLGVLAITFTLTSPPAEELPELETRVRQALRDGYGRHLVSLEGESLAESLGGRLLAKGWTLACAESLTGGLVSRKIVSVPGASRYYQGGVVAYANEAKTSLLGVPPGILERHGAVSEETARAMVRGARARFNASCAVATTGVAGPTGGSPEKPEGTVWVAAGTPEGEWARKLFFPLDRASVMELSANYALYLLWSRVEGVSP